ncbi:hypothetical protein Q4610_04275 [Sphingobium sp. HBC34]|uniref:Peptidase S10 n=1 Tax=Sphingobium cyanobacteriorum TaxID=3063954 RepID=A0ABT8ZI90_9SPHN|nr:hypothetical protein [Sphingobium sp. HBC34]MDO7834255.1 hypothetical protein [Sphingobium sp. HBC34]
MKQPWMIARFLAAIALPSVSMQRLAGAVTVAMMVHMGATDAVAQTPPARADAFPVAPDGPLRAVTTSHRITTPRGAIAYRATWFETVLRSPDGTPQATISATAYVRDGGDANRPVALFFNGGPGVSSSSLHSTLFGPRRLGERDAAGKQEPGDNPDTLLDMADLLFIDPVGTGFSRPLRADGGKPYWSFEGDAAAVLTLVREWLGANGRMASPLFIAGESYGGYRLGVMAKAMDGLNVQGLILVSPLLDLAEPDDQQAINRLPTMAVAAWHHRRRPDDRRTVDQVWQEARAFAQSDYALALQQGSALPAAERAAMAARLAPLIGWPQSAIEAADLRVDLQQFLETLVSGRIASRFDVRIAAPEPAKPINPDRPDAGQDPLITPAKSNFIVSQPMGDYLRNELKVPTAREYYALAADVNFNWDWSPLTLVSGAAWSVTGNIAKLMRDRPQVRTLLIGGYYDLVIPLLGVRYAFTHNAVPLDRLSVVTLPSGHSALEGDTDKPRGMRVIRDFIAGKPDEGGMTFR